MKKILSILAMAAVVLGMASCGDGNDPEQQVIKGKFTVDKNGTQVQFSKGNLQASTTDLGTNWTWAFAEHQWDYVGNAAANTSITGSKTVSSNGTVDLFGWSTLATYYGINESANYKDYFGNFFDWGTTIGEGWRTLSTDEWVYLFYGRTDAAHLFGMGSVNGVNGTILLPDNWAGDKFTDTDNGLKDEGGYYRNSAYSNYSFHTYATKQWETMEAQGAVFLPAVGVRIGAEWYVSMYRIGCGYYWSATPYEVSHACTLLFGPEMLHPGSREDRYSGISVRLVKNVE